jgi:hypothetical protein
MLSVGVQKNCGYGNFNHWCNVSPVNYYAVLDVGEFYKKWPVCADRMCVVSDCRKFEKHCCMQCSFMPHLFCYQFWFALGNCTGLG